MRFNKLTERLLAEGYDAKHYPDYVRIPPSNYWRDRDNPLDNFEGGFIYKRKHVWEQTFETPCGMLVKGLNTFDGMSYKGIEHRYENDNPLIHCPKRCVDCPLREIETDGVTQTYCVVHPTDREYCEAGSVEEVKRETDERIEQEKQAYIDAHGGRVCPHHMKYDPVKGWSFHYTPTRCPNEYCKAVVGCAVCPVLGRELTSEKGNVFFDLEKEGRDYSKDGTFFEGERFHTVKKGLQLFDKPINLDLAEIIAKQRDFILWRVRYSKEIDTYTAYKSEQGLIDWSYKVTNIRAEKKAVRDFDQDLEDIENGIQVYHAIDEERKKKEDKSKKRKEAEAKRQKSAEKKIKKDGWDNMSESEKRKASKMFEAKVLKRIIEESREKQPEQMTIFDFME